MTNDKKIEIAKKFLDALIYDNDFVYRWNPFVEEKHYADWPDKLAKVIVFPDGDEEFYTDDNIDLIAIGDYDLKEELMEKHPEMRGLDSILDEYLSYLEEIDRNAS